jgi:FKBP-type peptidyl-prolyl cis-trans isomerase
MHQSLVELHEEKVMLTSTRSIVAITSCLLVAGLASAVALRVSQMDYSRLPADPAAMQKQLDELGASLADAVRKAEAEVGGKAQSAILHTDASPPNIAVVVFAEGAEHHVTFNARDMSISSKETLPPYEMPGWEVEGSGTRTASGLKYWDIVEGEGPAADATKRVTVHYTGYLVDGRKFDSSHDRGQPATFPLSGVIPGWTEGVGTMREGGRRKLAIPYQMAYGAGGRPPSIPPRALLIFDVELITVHE